MRPGYFCSLIILSQATCVLAQTRPTSREPEISVGGKTSISAGYMLEKGEISSAFTYFSDSYDRFWVGREEMALPSALEEITTQGLVWNFRWGLTNDTQLSVNLPYTHAEADSETPAAPPQAALGDVEIGMEWRAAKLGARRRTDVMTTGAVRFPAAEYVADLPVAIGDHSTDVYLGAVAFTRWSDRLFTTTLGSLGLRSGESPNDFRYMLQIGTDGRNYAAAFRYEHLLGFSGTDIGGGSFPSNKGEYKKVGASLFFRPLATTPIGLTADVRWIVDGRNIGKAFGYSLGMVFDLSGTH